MEVHWQSQGAFMCTHDSSSSRHHHTFCTDRGLDLTVSGFSQVEVGVRRRHQDGILVRNEAHRKFFIFPPDDVRGILKLSPGSTLDFAMLCTVS